MGSRYLQTEMRIEVEPLEDKERLIVVVILIGCVVGEGAGSTRYPARTMRRSGVVEGRVRTVHLLTP